MNPMSLLTMSPEMLREASHRQSELRVAARLARKQRVATALFWTGSVGSLIAAFVLHTIRR